MYHDLAVVYLTADNISCAWKVVNIIQKKCNKTSPPKGINICLGTGDKTINRRAIGLNNHSMGSEGMSVASVPDIVISIDNGIKKKST